MVTLAPVKYASRDDILRALALLVLLTPVLAFGFVPTSTRWGVWGFPLLAFFFNVTLPLRKPAVPQPDALRFFWRSLPLPVMLSVLSGIFHRAPAWNREFVIWYLICVPIGEELLFRGWNFKLFENLWPLKYLTPTNPLPISVWASGLAFSLWHLQNWIQDPLPWVFFQCGYTFIVGVWLATIRWKTAHLWPALLAHALLNIGFALFSL